MNNAIAFPPPPVNEPIKSYAPGSPERSSLQKTLQEMRGTEVSVHPVVGGERVEGGTAEELRPPHDLSHKLGVVHKSREEDIQKAIAAALEARHDWMRMDWTDRAAIFLRAAELLAGPFRDRLNATTMLGQSKNPFQAEIDSACELIDFFRFNVHFAAELYAEQPISSPGIWNRTEYRPLEGFVFAITPFNFTSIAGNLPTAPALMGNTVLWKPASTQVYSAHVIMELLEAAGLPPGVINMLPGDGADVGDPVLASKYLSGLHFTGSTGTFQHLWRTIGENIAHYRSYPRIVGETGGKDFIVAHASANPEQVATAIVRGGFEYQGQKCSAASRVYVDEALWPQVETSVLGQLDEVKMGPAEDFTNFVNAVIDKPAYEKITGYIDRASKADGVKIIAGGTYDNAEGYFVAPTVLTSEDPHYETMEQEIFGPVVSVHVVPEKNSLEETLDLVDSSSPYALTGAVFAHERSILASAMDQLTDSAGNFYLNDKPTGAVVGQQPFGGARGSGTNDKAGSKMNLLRWVSARSIKENFAPPSHFSYPFLGSDGDQQS